MENKTPLEILAEKLPKLHIYINDRLKSVLIQCMHDYAIQEAEKAFNAANENIVRIDPRTSIMQYIPKYPTFQDYLKNGG